MATEIVKTIRASGGDYTTLSAWEAALPASLVTADEQHTAVCYNDWPSGLGDSVTISGLTTDATRFAKVTVAEGHRHNGTPHSGFYIYGNAKKVTVSAQYTRLEWIDVENTATGNYQSAIAGQALYVSVTNCLARTAATGTLSCAFGLQSGSNTEANWVVIENCLAHGGLYGYGNDQDTGRTRQKVYNSVAVNCVNGFNSGNTQKSIFINCAGFGNTTSDFLNANNHASSTNNASEDSTATSPSSITGISSADFIDAAGGDFHLASGSALIGAGANLYATFDLDIDGDIRPSSGAWDIGFDHYVASGGTNTDTAAGSGSIAIAGSATAALRTHLGAAASGSTAVTGSAANGIRTLLTAASSGSIALTGSEANGVYTPVGALTSAADSGSISVTSVAAIGKHDYLTAAGLGSITVTGSAASAAKSLGATAGAGGIALTGSSALAIRAWLSGAETGSVALTGSSAIGVKAAPGTGTLDPSTIAAIADAVWGHADAIAAHAALDDILARVTC